MLFKKKKKKTNETALKASESEYLYYNLKYMSWCY